MPKHIRAVFFLTALVLTTLVLTGKVTADGNCTPVYGGGEQCPRVGQVLIDKKVLNPSTRVYVDNLSIADPKYRTQQIISFRIIVKNSGDINFDKVTVTDKLPAYVDFMTGPGNFNQKTNTVTFDAVNVTAGSTQVFEIKGRTSHPSVLPKDKNVVCTVNTVDAVWNNQKDHDESQFCIEKRMVVPTVPKAGPENWILTLGGLGSAMITGIYLKLKSKIS